MNKQRKVLITITYNEMGIITDTKAEEVAQPVEPRPVCEDAISKRFIQDSLLHRISHLNAQGEKAIDTARELIQFKKFIDGITPLEPKRPQGEWMGYEVPSECSVCGHHWDEYVSGQDIWHDGSVPNYCPNCGADMRGNDYQRHIEDLEHFMRYEPTYNPEDGSM